MNDGDALRSITSLGAPDRRMLVGVQDPQSELAARHAFLSTLALDEAVPEHVRTHFETAKNVLLYSWCVYRFHMVAELYALSTLEFAFRERLRTLGIVSFEDTNPPSAFSSRRRAREVSSRTTGSSSLPSMRTSVQGSGAQRRPSSTWPTTG